MSNQMNLVEEFYDYLNKHKKVFLKLILLWEKEPNLWKLSRFRKRSKKTIAENKDQALKRILEKMDLPGLTENLLSDLFDYLQNRYFSLLKENNSEKWWPFNKIHKFLVINEQVKPNKSSLSTLSSSLSIQSKSAKQSKTTKVVSGCNRKSLEGVDPELPNVKFKNLTDMDKKINHLHESFSIFKKEIKQKLKNKIKDAIDEVLDCDSVVTKQQPLLNDSRGHCEQRQTSYDEVPSLPNDQNLYSQLQPSYNFMPVLQQPRFPTPSSFLYSRCYINNFQPSSFNYSSPDCYFNPNNADQFLYPYQSFINHQISAQSQVTQAAIVADPNNFNTHFQYESSILNDPLDWLN